MFPGGEEGARPGGINIFIITLTLCPGVYVSNVLLAVIGYLATASFVQLFHIQQAAQHLSMGSTHSTLGTNLILFTTSFRLESCGQFSKSLCVCSDLNILILDVIISGQIEPNIFVQPK